jgi:multidrug resistance efflux pump
VTEDPSIAVPSAEAAAHPAALVNPRRKWLAWLLPSLVLLAGLAIVVPLALGSRSNRWAAFVAGGATAEANANQPLAVVQRGEISRRVLLDGELRAVRSRTVFADMPDEAKITWLPPEGTLVKVGDRLAELDSTAVLSKIKEAEERLVTAENEIIRLQSQQEGQLRDLQVELSRFWLAYEKAKVEARLPAEVLPRRDYQEKQFTLEKTKTEYENHLAKIAQKKREFAADLQVKTIEKQRTENQLEQAKSGLKGMQIKAPTDGMVLYTDHWNERRKVQVGDVVWGGLPILSLPDLDEMEALAQVNEVDGPKLAVGNKATVVLDSYPNTEITATVKDISQTAAKASWQAKAKVFTVIFALDRTMVGQMKPGMSAQVAVIVGTSGQQLLIPRAAVSFTPEAVTVTRLEGETERRPLAVTILATDAKHYAVAANGGLQEGDRILLQK